MFKLCAQKLIGSPLRVSKFIELVCLALVVALQVEQVALSIQQVLHEFTVLVFALDALEAAARKVCRILNVNYIGVFFVLKHLVLAGKLVISKLVAVFFVLVGSILQELVARAAIKVVGLSTLHIVVTLARHVERLLLAVRFELDASHAGHASRQIKVLLAKATLLTLLNLNIKSSIADELITTLLSVWSSLSLRPPSWSRLLSCCSWSQLFLRDWLLLACLWAGAPELFWLKAEEFSLSIATFLRCSTRSMSLRTCFSAITFGCK